MHVGLSYAAMETIGNEPDRVKACFRDPRIKYAA